MKVIVVDDDVQMREMLGEVLAMKGHKAVGYPDYDRDIPTDADAYILDYCVPSATQGGDWLRDHPGLHPRSVLISGTSCWKGWDCAATLKKPFRLPELFAAIDRAAELAVVC